MVSVYVAQFVKSNKLKSELEEKFKSGFRNLSDTQEVYSNGDGVVFDKDLPYLTKIGVDVENIKDTKRFEFVIIF